MLQFVTTTQFRKDYKRIRECGYDSGPLKHVPDRLISGEPLDLRYRGHSLSCNCSGSCECCKYHIYPDWLLSYRIDNDQLFLTSSLSGIHSDLFAE